MGYLIGPSHTAQQRPRIPCEIRGRCCIRCCCHLSGLALDRRQYYWICAIAFISLATTSFGSFAYDSASQDCWPSVIIHFRKSFTTSRFAPSVNFAGISSQVKLAIGYAAFPSGLVMETRKSSGMNFAVAAAAAETLAKSAFTKAPEEFLTFPRSEEHTSELQSQSNL